MPSPLRRYDRSKVSSRYHRGLYRWEAVRDLQLDLREFTDPVIPLGSPMAVMLYFCVLRISIIFEKAFVLLILWS
jgi:hypothetical protein